MASNVLTSPDLCWTSLPPALNSFTTSFTLMLLSVIQAEHRLHWTLPLLISNWQECKPLHAADQLHVESNDRTSIWCCSASEPLKWVQSCRSTMPCYAKTQWITARRCEEPPRRQALCLQPTHAPLEAAQRCCGRRSSGWRLLTLHVLLQLDEINRTELGPATRLGCQRGHLGGPIGTDRERRRKWDWEIDE